MVTLIIVFLIDFFIIASVVGVFSYALTKNFQKNRKLIVFFISLITVAALDLIWYPAFSAADVKIIFGNPDIIKLIGSDIDLTKIVTEFGWFDIFLYIIQAFIALFLGNKISKKLSF
jgi:hypothetical protein